jgi:hypothetical protein
MKDEPGTMFCSSFSLQPSSFQMEAMKGVEPLSFGLQDRRSFYPIELHRPNDSGVGSRESVVFALTLDFILETSDS